MGGWISSALSPGVPAKGPDLGSQERSEKRKVERSYLRFMSIGVQFGLTITLLVLGGRWLDEKLDLTPILTVTGALVGIVGGMASVIYGVLGTKRK